jgi:hypothetical protein
MRVVNVLKLTDVVRKMYTLSYCVVTLDLEEEIWGIYAETFPGYGSDKKQRVRRTFMGREVLGKAVILPHHCTASQPRRWRQQSCPKRYPTMSLHGITPQNTSS